MKLPSVGGPEGPVGGPVSRLVLGLRRLAGGRVPLAEMFFWRMLVTGTILNLIAMVAGLVLFSLEAPTALASAVYFSPIPYNVLLLVGVWQSAKRRKSAWSSAACIGSVVWFVLMLVV